MYTFECCAALPDGKVVMVPCNYPAIVLFDPATKTLEEVGHLEGSYKSECCAALPDGKVVMVPCMYMNTFCDAFMSLPCGGDDMCAGRQERIPGMPQN